jgi:hypothetical protein
MSDGGTAKVVWAVVVANAGIAISKFAAAAIMGSSSLLSEGGAAGRWTSSYRAMLTIPTLAPGVAVDDGHHREV